MQFVTAPYTYEFTNLNFVLSFYRITLPPLYLFLPRFRSPDENRWVVSGRYVLVRVWTYSASETLLPKQHILSLTTFNTPSKSRKSIPVTKQEKNQLVTRVTSFQYNTIYQAPASLLRAILSRPWVAMIVEIRRNKWRFSRDYIDVFAFLLAVIAILIVGKP